MPVFHLGDILPGLILLPVPSPQIKGVFQTVPVQLPIPEALRAAE